MLFTDEYIDSVTHNPKVAGPNPVPATKLYSMTIGKD